MVFICIVLFASKFSMNSYLINQGNLNLLYQKGTFPHRLKQLIFNSIHGNLQASTREKQITVSITQVDTHKINVLICMQPI